MGIMVTDRRRGLRFSVAAALLLLALAVVLLLLPQAATGAVVSVKATPASFSPNGDKVQDKAKISVRVARAGKLFVGVYDPKGKLVTTLQPWRASKAGARTYTWNGLKKGKASGNAVYSVRAKVKVGRRVSTGRGVVTLDTRPPLVRFTAGMEPTVFAGGGLTVELSYTVDEAAGTRLALAVYHPEAGKEELGEVLGTREEGAAAAAGAVTWDGCATPGSFLPSSRYCLVLVAIDAAGNSGRSQPLGASVFAPTTVTGKVVTDAGAPVGGAQVTVIGTDVQATSGADGSFTFGDCPMGLRVLRAAKAGMEDGGAGARVNMSPATWTIVMGKQTKGTAYPGLPAAQSSSRLTAPRGSATPRAGRASSPPTGVRGWGWDDLTDWFDSETYTMSGSFAYELKDGVTRHPMANVKVVLRDIWIDVFGQQVWTEIASSSTDADGSYDFTYTVSWDDVGTPDVVVCALAVDKDGEVADVSAPYAGGTWACTGEYWENNAGDRLQRNYVDESAGRVVFRLLDAVRSAHSIGYERSSIDITYPANWFVLDSGADGCYQDAADTIHIGDGAGWGATIFHEYGHAWMRAAYDRGGGDNAYDDYESDAETDYTSFFSEEDRWTAFREAWAQFVALRTGGCDSREGGETYECDYDTPGADDSKIINSVARVLWDLYDDSATWIWYSWVAGSESAGPRLYSHYGVGDDDNVQVAGTSSGLETALKHILDVHYPETINELRTYLLDYFPANAVLRRGIDGAFYRQGVVAGVNENVPHVDAGTVLVTGDKRGAAYTGTVTLWCRVTDADSPGGASDMDRMKVRFEGTWKPDGGGVRGEWAPLTCTLQKAAAPPPGQSGSGWFKAEWDTTAPSPVEIIPQDPDSSPLFARYVENLLPEDNTVTAATTGGTARRDFNWVRAIAFDGLAESDPVESQMFAINNGPDQGVSGTVKNAVTLMPIAGATVELRQGTTSMAGTLIDTVTTSADGAYAFLGVAPGGYTVIAVKTGFATNHRIVTVQAGTMIGDQDILLTPESQTTASMRSTLDGYIRWARSTDNPSATFELWFRPAAFGGLEQGNTIAQISRDYSDWMGGGPCRWGIMQIQFSGSLSSPTLDFWINENVGDERGTIHRVTSTTQLQLWQWYHIAAQNGSQGMKLFVNGHLEASNTYTKGAEPNQGASPGGWFSLGDNRTVGSGYMSAVGDFRGLRVSNVQRYPNDFVPQDSPPDDVSAVISDPLAGTTTGVNVNFVPTPPTTP